MSKPLDSRPVEYAYVYSKAIRINQSYGDGKPTLYKHIVMITYELLDASKNHLAFKQSAHFIDGLTAMDTAVAADAKIAAASPAWILADKALFSGYVAPTS